jgi:nicotinamide mononucleotide (NMN) deamidase PncC
MKRPILKSVIITIFFLFITFGLASVPKTAFASYDGGNLIDNITLLNASTMTESGIQNFLVSKGGGIANKTFLFDCSATDASEVYYINAGAPCGKVVPASSIIYYASQIYGINPQAVLATLQKEQSLITTTDPTDWQLNQAMGYGCPTNGGCGASNFLYQIDNGVWDLRLNMERARGNMTWWFAQSTWVCGYEHTGANDFYRPNLYPQQNVSFYDQDGVYYRTHYIANAATSSLYCYTPHAYNNPDGLYGLPPYGTTGRYYSGSYNFVASFEQWFGPTQAPNYSATYQSVANYTDSSKTTGIPANVLGPGQRTYMVLKFKNTGNITWHNSGSGAVRLATFNTSNSPFCDATWISCNRPAELKEATVNPGDVGTFEFWYKAPVLNVDTTIVTQFGVISEMVATMSGTQQVQTTLVQKANYSATYQSVDNYTDSSKTTTVPANVLAPNQRTYMVLKFKNTGNITWHNSGSGAVRLATFNTSNSPFCDATWISCNRPAELKEATVNPGDVGTFEFWYKAPVLNVDTTIVTQFGVISEMVATMSGTQQVQTTLVQKANYSATYQSVDNYTDSSKTTTVPANVLAPNQRTYMVLKFKNTGNITWHNSGSGAVRLATFNTSNSPFCDATWISCNRPAELKEATVNPGDVGTFEFWYKAPVLNVDTTIVTQFGVISEMVATMSGTQQVQTTLVQKAN